ncbi:MAG: aspartyl/asparaginyl beta-hydroxylase domain-containing protein [Acidobacteria bacterium]|nr:MAG: aspartyl/asparaginyl beta-hydroxylase domain-containing protein [Acidobacteriota bacterium]
MPHGRAHPAPDDDAPTTLDYSRRVRVTPPRSRRQALLRRVGDLFERAIAAASVHGDPPVYAPDTFPWVAQVEASWRAIRDELTVLLARRAELASFHEIARDVATITSDDRWKTFFIAGYGLVSPRAAAYCPRTVAALERIPGMLTAMFSILAPGKHIPQHRGPYAGVLRYHLGLVVPRERARCRIRVADRVLHWEEGRSLVFDDTYNHEVWNDTDEWRAVLFVDFERPLRQPMRALNRAVLRLAARSRPLREARARQLAWEDAFFARDGGASPADGRSVGRR